MTTTHTQTLPFNLEDILRATSYQGFSVFASASETNSPTSPSLVTTTITIPFSNSPSHTPIKFNIMSPCAGSCCATPRSCSSDCSCNRTTYSNPTTPSPTNAAGGQTFFPSSSPGNPSGSWGRGVRYTRLAIPKGDQGYAALANLGEVTAPSTPSSTCSSHYDNPRPRVGWAKSPIASPVEVLSPGGRSVHFPDAISEPGSAVRETVVWRTQSRSAACRGPLTPYAPAIRRDSDGESVESAASHPPMPAPPQSTAELKVEQQAELKRGWLKKLGAGKQSGWARWRMSK